MNNKSDICIECKEKVIYSHDSYFCKDCANYFYKGDNMKKFIIKLDDKYYTGEGESVKRNASGNGWHIQNLGSSSIAVGSREQAKEIEGYTNLNIHWKRIYDAMRYNEIECQKIVIETIKG